MKKWTLFLLTLILSAFYYKPSAHSASWPLFRATQERTGAISEQAASKLTPLWKYEIQGEIISSPVVYKNMVYIGSRDGSVWGFDSDTGEAAWQYSTGGWIDATPCVSSTTVYVPSRDGYMYAFNRLSGDIIWKTLTGSTICSSPVLYDGKVYILSGYPDKKVLIFSSDDGAILNSYDTDQFGFSSVAIKENLLFFGTNNGAFNCLDINTGQKKWSVQTQGGIFYSTVALFDNALYAVSGGDERRLFCIDPATGKILWQSIELDNMTSSVSSVAASNDKIFVASSSGNELKLFAFPLSGTTPVSPLWSIPIGTPHSSGIVSSPAVADDSVYIGSGNGFLYSISASNGQYVEPGTGNLSTTPTGYYLCYSQSPSTGIVSSPAVSNGKIYVGTKDGIFWALQAEKVTAIESPENDDLIVNTANILGTTIDPSFNNYNLEYAKGSAPASWTQIASGSVPAISGELATWDTSGLIDGVYSLRLTVNDLSSSRAINRVTLNNKPHPPLNVAAKDTPFDGGGSLDITWDRSPDDGSGSNDVSGYKIYKSSFAGNFVLLKQLDGGTTSYTDKDCPVYTTYYYTLEAFDKLSDSNISNTAGASSLLDGVEITPENGGTIKLESGGLVTEVVFEPGSVDKTVLVGIKIPESYSDTGISQSATPTKIVREFGITPEGTKFLKPVTVKIPYREQDISGIKQEYLRIYWWDSAKNEWRIINTSNPLAENNRVWATIPHFSLYRIMGYTPGMEDLLSEDKVYTYPNPATGTTLSFKYYLGDKADVVIDIYNVAGELIARLEQQNNPAGIVSDIAWNISGIASGTYIYRIEARSDSKTKSIKKKLAIIH